jgi:hypothetical protein
MILGTEVSDLLSLNLAIRRQIYFNYISIWSMYCIMESWLWRSRLGTRF